MTEEGKKRIDLARSTYYFDFPDAAHPFEKFDDLGPYDRCITRGVLASMLPTGYNMGTEMIQIPGAVVIRNEMIHETRITPVDGRPQISAKIRQWMGESRGRWEGNTLVIETTNFNGKVGMTRNGNTLLASPDLKLTERLTRVSADTLDAKYPQRLACGREAGRNHERHIEPALSSGRQSAVDPLSREPLTTCADARGGQPPSDRAARRYVAADRRSPR
jgi:hypothetical protein